MDRYHENSLFPLQPGLGQSPDPELWHTRLILDPPLVFDLINRSFQCHRKRLVGIFHQVRKEFFLSFGPLVVDLLDTGGSADPFLPLRTIPQTANASRFVPRENKLNPSNYNP